MSLPKNLVEAEYFLLQQAKEKLDFISKNIEVERLKQKFLCKIKKEVNIESLQRTFIKLYKLLDQLINESVFIYTFSPLFLTFTFTNDKGILFFSKMIKITKSGNVKTEVTDLDILNFLTKYLQGNNEYPYFIQKRVTQEILDSINPLKITGVPNTDKNIIAKNNREHPMWREAFDETLKLYFASRYTPATQAATVTPVENTLPVDTFLIAGSFNMSNFNMPYDYTCVVLSICGTGGNGATTSGNTDVGGGGAAAYIRVNMPYEFSSATQAFKITNISAAPGTVTIIYTDINDTTKNYTLSFIAGNGGNPNINKNTPGVGGIATFNNGLSFLGTTSYFNTLILSDGPAGGPADKNGISNGFTSSGSGSSVNGTVVQGNPPKAYGMPLPLFYNSSFNDIYSQGGGSDVQPFIYGAGGASIPRETKIPSSTRIGVPGFTEIMAGFPYKESI